MPGTDTSSSSSPRTNDLPLRPADKALHLGRRNNNIVSHIELPPSPADSNPTMPAAASPPPSLSTEEQRITRQLDRGAPGDQAIFSERKTPEQKELARRKSQYYGDVFAHREPQSSARERVTKESIVMADIRTNVIIEDEYAFVTDLSYFLSQRYSRPENSILVTVAHSACLLFAGNWDPAYTMTINALPCHLQPVTNKRNASLIAKHMMEALGVLPNRGLIKFVPIPEENLAIDGKTVTMEIEELEKETASNNFNLNRSLSRGASTNKGKRRHSMRSLRNLTSTNHLPTHEEQMTPPLSDHQSPPLPPMPTEKSATDLKAEKAQKMGRRKSFIAAMFGKS